MSALPEPAVARTGAAAAPRAWLSVLGRVVPPLTAPLVLLILVATHAVNVPFWDEWDLLPFVFALRDGQAGLSDFWAQHNEHRLAAVKLVMTPLVLATDFDVRAMMYAGFALQLLAFAFLWRVLAATLAGAGAPFRTAVAVAVALWMFSPAQDQNWLWGETSLQWHLGNFAPAAAVWLLGRRLPAGLTLAACFVLTCAAMLAVASGIMLWGTVLVALATAAIAAGRWPRWPVLAGWAAGALVLAGYFVGLRGTPGASDPLYFLYHPLEFAAFAAIYLGWPTVQGSDLGLAGTVGLVGLGGLAAAFHAALVRGFLTDRILPWAWLATHALLVAVATAVGRVQTGLFTATTNRYSTGALFFWIGLVVVAAVTLRHWLDASRGTRRRAVMLAVAAATITAGLGYARLYRIGCRRFVQARHDRLVGLAEVWAYETAPEETLTLLYPIARHVRESARLLEARRLGPFAPRMSALRRQLEPLTATTDQVVEGHGSLDVADCTAIAGWAWDRRQPDVPVKVKIFADGVRRGTVPAYWYRRDLATAGIGNGHHAFVFTPPADLKDGGVHFIRARISGTQIDLAGFPKRLVCPER